MNDTTRNDRIEIRELIENWALWRDAGDWERFATVWHPDGRMFATWFQASATEFMARSRAAFAAGVKVYHSLGGSTVDVAGLRALAQTKMQIIQRALVHDVEVDVCCYGRFWDVVEKRSGRWGLLQRRVIYETDRMSPVDPSASLKLDAELLKSFPEGYRHLAYLQTKAGMKVFQSLPGTRGPEVEALQARGQRWLAGDDASCLDTWSV
jgi:SnoaL-like domain